MGLIDNVNDLEVEVRISYRGKRLHLDRLVLEMDLEDIKPEGTVSYRPEDVARMMKRKERRERFVDALRAQMAHAITEGLYKYSEGGR